MLPQLLTPDVPAGEIILRGSLIYWFIFLIFRLVLRRDIGAIGIADVLVIVLIADAAQNGMTGSYESVGSGMILIGVLAFWNVAIDFVAYKSSFMRRILEPPKLVLVQDGKPLRRALRREFISIDELMANLREKGVDQLSKVKRAIMESNGEISVIAYDDGDRGQDSKKPVLG